MIRKGWLLFLAVLLTAGFAGETYAASVDLSGQVRVRAEYRENFDWSDTIDDENAWVEQRTRLTANATVSDDVSAKVTIQDSRLWGEEAGTADTADEVSALDLHEGYLQVGNLFDSGLTLKMGRQKIVKGDQRILGGFEWSNNARAFDGIALVHSNDQATVTAAWVKVDEAGNVGKGPQGVSSDEDTDLWAVYAEIKAIPNNQLDVYAILLRDGNVTVGNLADSLYTIGARLAGNLEDIGVDYTVEIPFQFGDAGSGAPTDDSYAGWAVAIKGGYTVPGDLKFRIGAEYNLGSGDDTPGDDEIGTFVDMGLGTNHLHYGYMDIHGNTMANRTHWNVNAKLNATPDLSVYGAFWGHKATEVAPGADDDLGTELNLQAAYKLAEGTKVVAGYGRGFAGDALGTTAEDQDWGFVMVGTNF